VKKSDRPFALWCWFVGHSVGTRAYRFRCCGRDHTGLKWECLRCGADLDRGDAMKCKDRPFAILAALLALLGIAGYIWMRSGT